MEAVAAGHDGAVQPLADAPHVGVRDVGRIGVDVVHSGVRHAELDIATVAEPCR